MREALKKWFGMTQESILESKKEILSVHPLFTNMHSQLVVDKGQFNNQMEVFICEDRKTFSDVQLQLAQEGIVIKNNNQVLEVIPYEQIDLDRASLETDMFRENFANCFMLPTSDKSMNYILIHFDDKYMYPFMEYDRETELSVLEQNNTSVYDLLENLNMQSHSHYDVNIERKH